MDEVDEVRDQACVTINRDGQGNGLLACLLAGSRVIETVVKEFVRGVGDVKVEFEGDYTHRPTCIHRLVHRLGRNRSTPVLTWTK